MTQENLDSWDGFLGSKFLSAEDVRDEDQIFVCVDVEEDTENLRPILVLESESTQFKFGLNVTNATFIKEAGISSPKKVIGKKLTFKKVLVNNPRTRKEVKGLRVLSVSD